MATTTKSTGRAKKPWSSSEENLLLEIMEDDQKSQQEIYDEYNRRIGSNKRRKYYGIAKRIAQLKAKVRNGHEERRQIFYEPTGATVAVQQPDMAFVPAQLESHPGEMISQSLEPNLAIRSENLLDQTVQCCTQSNGSDLLQLPATNDLLYMWPSQYNQFQ